MESPLAWPIDRSVRDGSQLMLGMGRLANATLAVGDLKTIAI